jgi:glycosyltransferase involved in cell wall biosynthesis
MTDSSPPGRPLRILWLIKGLGPGGAENLLVAAARTAGGTACAYEVAYLLEQKSHLVPALADAGVPAHCLHGGAPWDLRWVVRLRRLVASGRHDVVHAHSPFAASLARLALRTLRPSQRPKLVYTEHNTWLTRTINRVTYPLDDSRVFVSSDAYRSVPSRLRRGEVIHHGIVLDDLLRNTGDRDETRAELGIPADTVVAITVANYRVEKAYPVLLEAASQVLARQRDVQFISVGQGPLEAEVHGLHERLGLGDGFRLLGRRSDVPRLLRAADLFVLSSDWEGLPVAVMEAMAAGLPVVATAVGGLPDVIVDGVNGRLVPPRQPDALAAAVGEVASNARLRTSLATAAAETGRGFDARVTSERLASTYRGLVRSA